MSVEILTLIININSVFPLFAIVILLITFRRNSIPVKWFNWGLIVSWLPVPVSMLLLSIKINPNYANTGYYILAPLLYMPFFYYAIKRPRFKRWFIIVPAVNLIFGIANVFFIQQETINSYSSISLSLMVITASLLYYYSLLNGDFTENIVKMPVFWFVTAFFILCSGQIMMVSFTFYLINVHQDNLVVLWTFHNGLSLITGSITLYGAILHYRQLKATAVLPRKV